MSIKLITAEVEQDQHFRPAESDHVADDPLVAFQDRDTGFGMLAERRCEAVMQVGSVRVVYQPTIVKFRRRTQGSGQKMRGRGLSIGA